MTTIKAKDFNQLIVSGYAFNNVVAFFMRDAGTTMADIGRSVRVDRAMVTMVISGKRESKPVKQAVSKALGFDPWDVKI